ncbi:MAG: hypothetical protein US53_C0011G0002 [Candidatus Woesebacteria bacterium GW2011_GWA1_37_7]|uniref:O-antigen ligase-related domain-containing protein n=1 Tax=Candidatus Woesebacteria bacterium GW2011_GWA1_37_7 TaxID=1618545 RepID=A0A0G0H6F7_9BACT|nr:MAG: hypothetical protein US53_C0011G0002 [Candidatus Woesebacteria bacterium GW2011_GWA1_37_7]
MIVVYIFTVIICSLWIIRMIIEKKLVFVRSILDIPILIFLFSQILSTVFSIDSRTSILGFYSRFHGGLFSSISYSLLYWAYVSNMDRKKVVTTIYSLFASSLFICSYAILEHFGIDKNVWVQDVQSRVFSTLGQPNWLAAYISALLPLTWALSLNSGKINFKKLRLSKWWLFILLSQMLFLTLIYTKSKSGFLGFLASDLLLWSGVFYLNIRKYFELKKALKNFIVHHLMFILLILISGSPFTLPIAKIINPEKSVSLVNSETNAEKPQGPALEFGGSDSGKIRKIVWRGAIDIWKNYPLLGTGVETFAFAYYKFRPFEHNLVSEWDFLYNKAHNEYLNYAATTGSFGLLSYLALILITILILLKGSITKHDIQNPKESKQPEILSIGLLSGYISILITNFFGFSVVGVALLFFLYPAFATKLSGQSAENKVPSKIKLESIPSGQKALIAFVLCTMFYVLFIISKYWYADYIYATGKGYSELGNITDSRRYLEKAVKLSPKEALYWSELAQLDAKIAVGFAQEGNNQFSNQYLTSSLIESDSAIRLSPANVNLKREKANNLLTMSAIQTELLNQASITLEEAVKQAPSDAKLWYNLALTYVRIGESEKGKNMLLKVIDMKPNYRNAHYALGLVYIDAGDKDKAIREFEYILANISPDDGVVKRELEEIK